MICMLLETLAVHKELFLFNGPGPRAASCAPCGTEPVLLWTLDDAEDICIIRQCWQGILICHGMAVVISLTKVI